MFPTPPNDLMPVVIYALKHIGDGDSAAKVEFDAMATPGKIRLIDCNTHQPHLIDGVLLTASADHEVGINPGSLFAVTGSEQPFPIFRRTPEGGYEADEGTLVTDVQMTQWSRR